MKTELFNKIIAEAKRVFGMTEDATEAELHDRLADASEDLKADLIVNVANQIASYAASEIERACELAIERISSGNVAEQIAAQFTIIENRVKALEDGGNDTVQVGVKSSIAELREEFGKEIAEVKAAIYRGPRADGDGREFKQFETREKASPIIKAFGAKIPSN
jgi:phage gp36-like protein